MYFFYIKNNIWPAGGQITSFKQNKLVFEMGCSFFFFFFLKKIKIIKSISRDLKILTKTETKNNIKRFLTYKILCSHAKYECSD